VFGKLVLHTSFKQIDKTDDVTYNKYRGIGIGSLTTSRRWQRILRDISSFQRPSMGLTATAAAAAHMSDALMSTFCADSSRRSWSYYRSLTSSVSLILTCSRPLPLTPCSCSAPNTALTIVKNYFQLICVPSPKAVLSSETLCLSVVPILLESP